LLKEEAISYKMQQPSHIQQRYLEERLKRKLRKYSEKISLDLEKEKELRMLRIISEQTLETDEELCLLHRLAEGI
jgi:hypothetical protein